MSQQNKIDLAVAHPPLANALERQAELKSQLADMKMKSNASSGYLKKGNGDPDSMTMLLGCLPVKSRHLLILRS